MKIQKFVLGALNTNCYILSDELSGQCFIIDPADRAEFISEELLRQQLQPQAILATHGHYDHILAAAELQLNFDIQFLIHKQDQFLVKDLIQRANYHQQKRNQLKPPQITDFLQSNQKLLLNQTELTVLHTPGHTPGSICLISHQQQIVFTGDTLFAGAWGRTDLSYSQPDNMEKSVQLVKNKCRGYRAYPGHGQEFII